MVGPNGIDLLYRVAEGHSFVRNEFDEVARRTLSRKQFELLVNGPRPQGNNARGNLS